MPFSYSEYLEDLTKRIHVLEDKVEKLNKLDSKTPTEELEQGLIYLMQLNAYRKIREQLVIQSN